MSVFPGQEDKVYPALSEFDVCRNSKTDNIQRKPTDVCFCTVFATFLTVMCCLVGYCMFNGDIGRVIYGYDNCGTVCGHLHRVAELKECYKTIDEKNFGSYHIVSYQSGKSKLYDRFCTNNCSRYEGYKNIFHRCLPTGQKAAIDKFFTKTGLKDLFVEISEDFVVYCELLIYMCLLSLVISLGFLVLFPFLSGALVWTILIGVVCASLAATVSLWISWKELQDLRQQDSEIKQREVWTYLGLAIASTLVTLGVVCVMLVMFKRIKLVIQLFVEAGRAISAMPGLLFEPVLTFLSLVITVSVWIYFCLWISSAGKLNKKRLNVYYYEKDTVMETVKVLNIFGLIWMVQFVIGCQHMIIAGAVSKWYFIREKSKLSTPILESFYNLTRYHLGTVALGSLLLAIVQFLRMILTAIQKKAKNPNNDSLVKACLYLCHCCLWILEHFLKMLSRNAYIITAMYGFSFYKAGKQAFTHLASNPLRVAAINSVGDFVLFLSKVLVVSCSVAVASYFLKNKEGIQHVWVPLVFIGLFSYFISHCFMTVYEMTIDTIFICFCEDCQLNDGISKPYYMSRGLMEFVEDSNQTTAGFLAGASDKSQPPTLSKAVELQDQNKLNR